MIRKILALAAVAVFSQTVAAAPLAEVEYLPGYEVEPVRRLVQILDSGEVRVTTQNYRTGEQTTRLLAELAVPVVATLAGTIDGLERREMVDLDAGRPECVDAPVIVTRFYQSGSRRPWPVFKQQSCHEYAISQWRARPVRRLLQGFLDLDRL